MFAIFQVGGKQYKVQEGDFIYVEKMEANEGEDITFSNLIMVNDKVGKPFVANASLVAKVEKHGKQKKINIIKFKSKKHHLKRQGHRQPYTKLLITKING